MSGLCCRSRAETVRGACVKLLLDENLSDRIVPQILDLFPDSNRKFIQSETESLLILERPDA